ncbi:unnamed protein product [Prorocentrum cordatum]|uniref:Uncharacterized protein n=1 Tax=Prorocentrum cordatum TaxID=2364126 RepID=A0ABN9STQ2_9DINO|nr:unnamed protein product [Polarella glacialis]
MPAAMGARTAALEVARGALLAAHSVAGLTTGCPDLRESLRMIRAAEGMLRAAVAMLVRPSSALAVAPQARPAAAPRRRRRRPRGRGGKTGEAANDKHGDAVKGMELETGADRDADAGAAAPPAPLLEDDARADELPLVRRGDGPPSRTASGKGKDKGTGKSGVMNDVWADVLPVRPPPRRPGLPGALTLPSRESPGA